MGLGVSLDRHAVFPSEEDGGGGHGDESTRDQEKTYVSLSPAYSTVRRVSSPAGNFSLISGSARMQSPHQLRPLTMLA